MLHTVLVGSEYLDKGFLKKLKKCDPRELICWVSSCQAPAPNQERVAMIEYALAVLLSLNYRKSQEKRKASRELVKRIVANAIKDFDEVRSGRLDTRNLKLPGAFGLGFLTIRGEAFLWQFAEASLERYGKHSEWMLSNLGFTILDAIHFSKEITKTLTKRLIERIAPPLPSFSKEQYYDPRYVFVPSQEFKDYWKTEITISEKELVSLIARDEHERFRAYLQRMSISINEPQPEIETPTDFNILYGKPFVKIDSDYLLPLPSIIWRTLSTTFHYDFLHDKTYVEKYIDEKGKAAERRVYKCFKKLFPEEELFPRVKYSKRLGWPDIDLLVNTDNLAFLIECTSKWVTIRAKSGNLDAIVKDLESSIVKCYNQLGRALKACQRQEIAIVKDKRLLPVIVVDDHIPHLDFILQFFDFLKRNRPYIINIYDLEIITDISERNEFIEFVSKRAELSERKRIFAADEVDYFVHYKKYGLRNFADFLEKRDSKMIYIAHMEELYPNYYKEHVMKFFNDESFAQRLLVSNINWGIGWS